MALRELQRTVKGLKREIQNLSGDRHTIEVLRTDENGNMIDAKTGEVAYTPEEWERYESEHPDNVFTFDISGGRELRPLVDHDALANLVPKGLIAGLTQPSSELGNCAEFGPAEARSGFPDQPQAGEPLAHRRRLRVNQRRA